MRNYLRYLESERRCLYEYRKNSRGRRVAYYFVDSKYQEADVPSIKLRAMKIHELRVSAKKAMDEAKALMGTNGTSDYYVAVKEYYKNISAFWNLISEFPEGYSKFTYSNTASNYKENCQSAYAELAFYK